MYITLCILCSGHTVPSIFHNMGVAFVGKDSRMFLKLGRNCRMFLAPNFKKLKFSEKIFSEKIPKNKFSKKF